MDSVSALIERPPASVIGTVSKLYRKQTTAKAALLSEECDHLARLAGEAAKEAQATARKTPMTVAIGAAAAAALQAAADAENSSCNATILFIRLSDRTLAQLDMESLMEQLERARRDAALAKEEAETQSQKVAWLFQGANGWATKL